MLKIDRVQKLGTVTVYGDDDDARDFVFYILPQGPRFRTDENGRPIFKYLKYRELRQEGADFFGGLITFDACLALPDPVLVQVKAELQQQVNAKYVQRGMQAPQVQVGPPIWTQGTVTLSIEGANNQMVQKVTGAGVPSLYGDNVASFWVELTKQGATIFEQAMQGQGGFVAAFYKMKAWAKLPPISGFADWHADKFYSFSQTINTDDNFWSEDSYEENIAEWSISHDISTVHLEMVAIPGMAPEKQQALEDELRTNLNKQLQAGVERNLLKEIQKADPSVKSLHEDQDIEDIKRTVSNTEIASVHIDFSETHTIEWPFNPQGTLPNITTMTGPDGPIKWADYAKEVDLNDPFFRTLEVRVQVNADFANLPIANVTAKLSYALGDMKVESFTFTDSNTVGRFRTFIVGDNRKFKYTYTVNYRGHGEPFVAPEVETDATKLTINVDDLGVWVVDIAPGDINFTQVKQAQLTVRLEDAATPIERQFTMTEGAHDFKIREVTMRPRRSPYKFMVKYFMADGKEFTSSWQDHDAPQLYINDPFVAMKTISLRAVGDLAGKIASIDVDLRYADVANNYIQTKTMALSQQTPFFDWTFPILSETAGKIVYSASINHKDGTSEEIAETVADRPTIRLGDIVQARLVVEVVPDLLDFTEVKLVQVALSYADAANGIAEHKNFILKAGAIVTSWTVDLKNKAKTDYTWSAKYFLADGTHRESPVTAATDASLILELPSA